MSEASVRDPHRSVPTAPCETKTGGSVFGQQKSKRRASVGGSVGVEEIDELRRVSGESPEGAPRARMRSPHNFVPAFRRSLPKCRNHENTKECHETTKTTK